MSTYTLHFIGILKLMLINTFIVNIDDTLMALVMLFQMLLKAKENEVLCLRKEISCLETEVRSLTKV